MQINSKKNLKLIYCIYYIKRNILFLNKKYSQQLKKLLL